jgi:hypothetical protein
LSISVATCHNSQCAMKNIEEHEPKLPHTRFSAAAHANRNSATTKEQ